MIISVNVLISTFNHHEIIKNEFFSTDVTHRQSWDLVDQKSVPQELVDQKALKWHETCLIMLMLLRIARCAVS